jgi:hypothetical protein
VRPLTDDELRAMVRESVARALGYPQAAGPIAVVPGAASHPSHFRYDVPQSDGPCLIEPTVPCTHCGYCQSHGH